MSTSEEMDANLLSSSDQFLEHWRRQTQDNLIAVKQPSPAFQLHIDEFVSAEMLQPERRFLVRYKGIHVVVGKCERTCEWCGEERKADER